MDFDIFNGDADGICALIQLRLQQPKNSKLVTGIKRDIQLLERITISHGDQLTVLDISFQKNHQKVVEFLKLGAHIFYADHHQSGVIPQHPNLTALIDTDSTTCTSLLINKYLNGKYPLWAITAAFGDNLAKSAIKLAKEIDLIEKDLFVLEKLGIYINYNSYGSSLEDLHIAPEKLYSEMLSHESPFSFINNKKEIFLMLEQGYIDDMNFARNVEPHYQSDNIAAYVLPDLAWARRVSGVLGNHLATNYPNRAHAVITQNLDGTFLISVRAPTNNKTGADELCSFFPGGGGRKAAAGINKLPADQLTTFIKKFEAFYSH